MVRGKTHNRGANIGKGRSEGVNTIATISNIGKNGQKQTKQFNMESPLWVKERKNATLCHCQIGEKGPMLVKKGQNGPNWSRLVKKGQKEMKMVGLKQTKMG
jgi:hypothetical protein